MGRSECKEIKEIVGDFITKNYLYWSDHIKVEDNQSLVEEGIVDSTGILELAAFLESTFKITIDDAEFVPDNLDTLNAISAFIVRKTNGRFSD